MISRQGGQWLALPALFNRKNNRVFPDFLSSFHPYPLFTLMNKIFTYCLFGFLFLMGATGLKSQSLTYGLVQDVNNPFQFTAVAYPTVSSGNVTIATAVFTFYLPAGTLTSPGIPVLPASGSFNNITGTWRIEKITPAYYAGFGFNAGDLQGRDVYQCILQDSPTPVFVANQPLSLFSF